jgi:hypothetical protein
MKKDCYFKLWPGRYWRTNPKVVKSLNMDIQMRKQTLAFRKSITTMVQFPIYHIHQFYICIVKIDVNGRRYLNKEHERIGVMNVWTLKKFLRCPF